MGKRIRPRPRGETKVKGGKEMKQHFIEVSELKTDKCFLDWRMTDNCLNCAHFVALVKSKDGKWKVLCETKKPTIA